VVDGVVEEEHLGRLDEDRGEGQQVVGHQPVHAFARPVGDPFHDRADAPAAEQRHRAADDAGREVVDQHLETGADPVLYQAVEELENEGGERAYDHRSEEHRNVRADNDADRRDGADDGATLAVDEAATGVADENRQQHFDHWADEFGEESVGQPSGGDEQRGDKPPGDERADVRHDHGRQVTAHTLDARLEAGAGHLGGVGHGAHHRLL
jgi:hypothetical protein